MKTVFKRILTPFVQLREDESITLVLMFAYSFFTMAGYNVVKPATRSQFIDKLGASNLPYVLLATGLLMSVVIHGYNKLMGVLPRRYVFPGTQLVMVGLLVMFWSLFKTGESWVSVAFYFWGALAGSLLISQFWTLANDIYDPRQAKRLFGFIGGGSSLGGMVGAGLAGRLARPIGTENLLLVGAALLAACFFAAGGVIASRKTPASQSKATSKEKGMSLFEAARLLVQSKHFRIIAIVISFASIGAGIIDQQLNMAVGEFIPGKDDRTRFLADVTFYSSLAGFFIQMTLTSRMHRLLGIGFALLILPIGLGSTALVMLLAPALWSSSLARVADTALRYTADKTTREILFMPLSTELKYKAKPFADVAVDRLARGAGAALALIIAIQVFHLQWWQLSYLSIPIAALWVFMAIRARKEYLETFRQTIETQSVEPEEVRLSVADLSTVETLVEELAHPDERRVLYAIDLLESLDKRNLITPLLLHHASDKVRARALAALGSARSEIAEKWAPAVERMLKDPNSDVRAAAVGALASIRRENAAELMRAYLNDPEPRIVATAAMIMADSGQENSVVAAEEAIRRLSNDTRVASAAARKEAALAIAGIRNPQFHTLLIPLIYDPDVEVARQAIRSARRIGSADALFVPALVSLQRHRLLKAEARDVLVNYGESILDVLSHFMRDQEEDIWVRRHIPGTLALIPSQKSMDLLVSALKEPDGFLRFKAVCAIEKLRREHPEFEIDRELIDNLIVQEADRYYSYLISRWNLFQGDAGSRNVLLGSALTEKLDRTKDRIYRLLALLYSWKDIAAARWALEHGGARSRSSAAEFLDNLLSASLRKRLMPLLEDITLDERVRRASVITRARPRDAEETLAELVHDEDQVLASAAIHYVEEKRMWKLEGELEHSLQFRTAKDWYVFEAASWALAACRLPAGQRRALWMEPLPAVELANRLRGIPLFSYVSIDELFRIAGMSRQVRYETGRMLYQQGTPAESLQFLMDGKIAVSKPGMPPQEREATCALAFDEVLEGSPMRQTVRTIDSAICLELNSDEFLTLLSNSSPIVQGLFRMFLGHRSAASWRKILRTTASNAIEAPTPVMLTPIEKTIVLQNVPIFSRATADHLLALAAITHQLPFTTDGNLFIEGDRPAIYIVLSGQFALDSPSGGEAVSARPGDIVGTYETLGGEQMGWRVRTVEPGSVLRIDRDELFDLLADNVDLLQGIFSVLVRESSAVSAAAAAL
jgi:ATP:ADP antiporter, AAA family